MLSLLGGGASPVLSGYVLVGAPLTSRGVYFDPSGTYAGPTVVIGKHR